MILSPAAYAEKMALHVRTSLVVLKANHENYLDWLKQQAQEHEEYFEAELKNLQTICPHIDAEDGVCVCGMEIQ